MLTAEQIDFILRTIGFINSPDYFTIHESVMRNALFKDILVTPDELEQIHSISKAADSRDAAITEIMEVLQKENESNNVIESRLISEEDVEQEKKNILKQQDERRKNSIALERKKRQQEEDIERKKRMEGEKLEIKLKKDAEVLANAMYHFRPKVSQYKVVRRKMHQTLVDDVCELIREGWEPLGGVSYAAAGMTPLGDTGNTFIQAMVKYEDF